MSAPLRVLWLIDSLTLGDAESLVPFSEALDRSKFELIVGSLQPIAGSPIEERLRAAKIDVVHIPSFGRLFAFVKERGIGVIHVHRTQAAIWGAWASRSRKIPVVATLHQAPTAEPLTKREGFREWLMLVLLNWRRARLIAVSEAVRQGFVAKYRYSPKKIDVIYKGVKPVRFERRNRERAIQLRGTFGFPADAIVITTVAGLRPSKGIDVLLRAMQPVVTRFPNARLLIAGEGPQREQWSALAQHLGVAGAVTWAGHRKDVPAILAGSDLFVLPSREEEFPAVLLEAMAAELPIVATSVGGVPEIIDSPAVGALVAPRDPAALGAEIVRMLEDEPRRRATGAAARRRVAEAFPIEPWINGLSTAYREASGERTGALRIALVEFAGKGGSIQYAFQLCRAMAKEGAEVTLLTDRQYEFEGVEHPFRVLNIFDLGDGRRALKYYGQWFRLADHLREEKYHVVQFGDFRFPTDFVPLALMRQRGRITAAVCHNVQRFVRGAGFRSSNLSYQAIYRQLDPIFVHYKTNAARFSANFPRSSKSVRVIAHGNQEIFRELRGPAKDLHARHGLAPNDQVVLFFGTLSREKGIDLLIEGFLPAALRHPGARLVIAGEPMPGFSVDHHLAMARGFALGDRVRIVPGYVEIEDVASWMELATVIVFPYRDLYPSTTVHLAQTFGVPIIATRVGAMSEVIEDGETGLLVPPDDPDALGDAIARVLEDPALAERLGESARIAAGERFNWTAVAREFLSAYEKPKAKG